MTGHVTDKITPKAPGRVTKKATGKILAGTSGFSYKSWQGPFYPEHLAQDQWLSFYASKLPSVEINNTFYRMPRAHVVESWRDSVPKSFRFVIKASRRITHQAQLKNAAEPTGYLLEKTDILGDRLGAILFQLPKFLRLDLDRLLAFQELLPDGCPAAFEFRHDSWLDPAVDEALTRRGHARVVNHDADVPEVAPLANALVYLRLRAPEYTGAALRRWRDRVQSANARTSFVFFKHEDAGAGPALAHRFLELIAKGKEPAKTGARRRKPQPKRAARSRSDPGRAASD